jgi:hypothetical protein
MGRHSSAVIEFLVEAAVEERQRVRVGDVDKLAGIGHTSGDAVAEGDADFLVLAQA